MVTAAEVEARLRSELVAADVRVEDLQGCGTSFEVFVISSSFEGKRVLERHKLVNAALAPLMPEIHALSIRKAKTPQEEEALQQQEQGQGQGQKQ